MKCVVSENKQKKKPTDQPTKQKKKINVTELYHSTFILGQVGIIQNKVVQNLVRNKVI